MSRAKQLYGHFDRWARNLSRSGYAALVGVVSFSSFLIVGALFGEMNLPGAVAIGVTLAALHFAFNSNAQT